jgi:hypothetical protein
MPHVCVYARGGLGLATWILAGPQGMKLTSFLSLMRCRALCTCGSAVGHKRSDTGASLLRHLITVHGMAWQSKPRTYLPTCVGSTSPWMMLRMEM